MKQIITEIQNRFTQALSSKTSWGRNEINAIYSQIVIDVLAENVSSPRELPVNTPEVVGIPSKPESTLSFDPNATF